MIASDSRDPDVSIVLLTYNGEAHLAEVLAAIFSQATKFTYEVISIDSGSSDRTVDFLKEHPIKLLHIANHDFGHGRTRNLGARYAAGRYVVFLTQDATPYNQLWLDNLVRSVAEDDRVAGAYSRQIPRPDCHPWEARDIRVGSGPISLLKRVNLQDRMENENYRLHQTKFIAFSNVSSCFRKSILQILPFSETIAMMEDQEWCKRALEAGHAVLYSSASVVRHSHSHCLKMIYRRHFDYGSSLRAYAQVQITPGNILFYTVLQSLRDMVFIVDQRGRKLAALKWMMLAPLFRFVMQYGLYRGLNSSDTAPIESVKGNLTTQSQSKPTLGLGLTERER